MFLQSLNLATYINPGWSTAQVHQGPATGRCYLDALISVLQAARRVPSSRSQRRHVDVNVIRRWVHTGKLTRHVRDGVLCVDARELDRLMDERKRLVFSPHQLASSERWHRLMVERAVLDALQ